MRSQAASTAESGTRVDGAGDGRVIGDAPGPGRVADHAGGADRPDEAAQARAEGVRARWTPSSSSARPRTRKRGRVAGVGGGRERRERVVDPRLGERVRGLAAVRVVRLPDGGARVVDRRRQRDREDTRMPSAITSAKPDSSPARSARTATPRLPGGTRTGHLEMHRVPASAEPGMGESPVRGIRRIPGSDDPCGQVRNRQPGSDPGHGLFRTGRPHDQARRLAGRGPRAMAGRATRVRPRTCPLGTGPAAAGAGG